VRRLAPEEAALWKRVIETVKPLKGVVAPPPSVPLPVRGGIGGGPSGDGRAMPPAALAPKPAKKERAVAHPRAQSLPKREGSHNTLDASWDRRLSRGLVSPESSIDLHGHSLASAHHRLDLGLEQAIAQGDRVLLLVTGKPPRADSERPHARGAIRAAVGDWLAGSRHAGAIAAVRGAHPRHGGSGALYIVLRRPRGGDPRRKF
jgi:DNA-nicking Smr family endonuclease